MFKRLVISLFVTALSLSAADALVEGFRNPPPSARPATYYLLLNGYVNRDYVDKELEAYKRRSRPGLELVMLGFALQLGAFWVPRKSS